MKITRIEIYKTDLPYVGGAYAWGAGHAIETAVASVAVIVTDAGIKGCGEFTPCGENYMVAHSAGVEAAARLLAPKVNTFPGLVRTARRTMGVGCTRSGLLNLRGSGHHGMVHDWGEVVTR